MTQFTEQHARVFQSRESIEYQKVLSDVMALQASPSATYPDLLSTSYELNPAEIQKLYNGETDSKIKRVIDIDYLGMAASVLLDKQKIYAPNSQYARLRDLIHSLKALNETGTALRMRLLLQYPYSLAGQNRILAESWELRTFIGEVNNSLRNEAQLAPALLDNDIESSVLVRNQQYCLQNLQDLLSTIEPDSPNKIAVRFASISTLICGLRVNNFFFYDPYHYGRKRNEDTCAITQTPIVMVDARSNRTAYDAFCNHFQYIWECDSTLDYHDVAYRETSKRTVFIRKPEKTQTSNKIERLKRTPSQGIDWELRSRQIHQVVNSICPIVAPVDLPEVGFLAAAWEQKHDSSYGPCEPALMLEESFKRGFEKIEHVQVAVLRSELGASLSRSLFELMNASTFSIIILTKEIEDRFCKPNVYIELGYLLQKNKGHRTYIVAERGMDFATDIQDITFLPFNRTRPQSLDEMRRIYKELLQAMWRTGIISKSTLDKLNQN